MSSKTRAPQKILFTHEDNVSLSKGSKKKSARQQFLSVLMSETSGDVGEELAQAFVRGHSEKLRELLGGVVETIVKKSARK